MKEWYKYKEKRHRKQRIVVEATHDLDRFRTLVNGYMVYNGLSLQGALQAGYTQAERDAKERSMEEPAPWQS